MSATEAAPNIAEIRLTSHKEFTEGNAFTNECPIIMYKGWSQAVTPTLEKMNGSGEN